MRVYALLALVLVGGPLPAQQSYPPAPQVRAAFLKLLDRPRVALDPQLTARQADSDGAVLEELTIATDKKADGSMERMPTLVLRPAKVEGRLPVVIVLHGTGGTKEAMLPFQRELVKRKIMAVSIDARYHGGRAGGAKGSAAYNAAIARAWKSPAGAPMEHPFYFDTCWDLWRLLDYLQTRADVDAGRIGMIGFSMGGIQTWLAASVDERVRVAVPAIAIQSFRWSLENDQWQGRANTIKLAHETAAKDLGESGVNQKVCRVLWSKIIPGILDEFDCPSMIRLFAGRPLLILSGTQDRNCPYGGAKIAIAAAEQAFSAAGASDRLRVIVEEVGHTVTGAQRQAALEWFERWLMK